MFEKKRGTRFLASVMALVMLLSLAPVGALATEDEGQPAENQAVAQSAVEGKGQQAGVDTGDTNENTPTEPTEPTGDSDSAEATKSEGGLDEGYSNADTSDNDNGIAAQNLSLNESAQEQPITAEYWVTNSRVTANDATSMTINASDPQIASDAGASVESLAPAEGTNVGGTAIFWQARVLPSDKHQTEGGGIDRTGDGQKIQKIRYFNSKFQYQVENNDNWTDFNTDKNSGNQLVFYYLIKTDFAENIQINVSDWPALKEPKKSDNKDHYDNYRKVTYQVYRMDENDIAESNPCDSKDTWYYSGVKISAVQVSKNELESCSIDRIEVSRTDTLKNGENPSVDSSSNADFRIDLSKVPAHTNVVVKIYVKVNKYLVTYKSDGEVFHHEAYKATTEVNQLTRIPKKEGFTFKGWTSEDVTVSNNKFTMPAKDVVFTAVWEENKTPVTPTEPTKAVDAKYFVLLPGRGTPASGKDQGTSYYLPNENNNGGITGLTYLTGYTGGGLTAAGQVAADGSYTNIDSTNGVFKRTGIDASYLVVPTNLGYFTVGNWTAEGVYSPTSTSKAALSNVLGENFNTKNISIIWYSLKKQFRDGRVVYHVDGYIKDIPVTLTYHDNFTGSSDSYTQNGLKSGETAPIAQNGTVSESKTFSHAGYVFDGWYDNADCTGTNYAGQTHTMMDNLNLYAKWEKIYTVTFNAGDNGTLGGNLTQTGVSGTTLTEPTKTPSNGFEFAGWVKDGVPVTFPTTITEDATYTATWKPAEVPPTTAKYTVNHYKWDVANKEYLLDESKELEDNVDKEVTATAKTYPDYTLNTQASTLKGTVTANNQLTLNLYYDIDKIGDGENKDQPDGIPDRHQVTINYVSSNTNWGSVNRSKEVITLINTESGKWLETGTVTAPSCTATSAGGRCYFVNWTKKQEGSTASSTVISSANLPAQTIENAKGGNVYTFTANFDRSSGGGSGGSNRPKPPVVEIPDDVPTGLNGKDHYAYIIGYGNNDVRPQNNITRAEVATIFFRLLTDETREANMTKSNGYNDVKDGDWFCCAVSTLSKMGIIKGYEDGSFKPNDPISRAEFAAIAARFDPDGDKTPATFADVTSHWAKDEISIAANHGWIKGYEDGSFKPDQKITRAETMTLVNRVLNRLPETKDDLHKDMKTWVDNMDETAWYYLAVQEATNSHYFKNKTSTKFEQWTDLRDTRDWSELEK